MELSNQEWAVLIWILVFIIYALIKDKKRQIVKAFAELLCTLSAPKIISVFVCAALWITFCIYMLKDVGAWETDNLKTTVLWSLTFAFVTLFSINRIVEDKSYFRKTARDVLSATVVISFITEFYSFPFAVELILVPFLTLIVIINARSEKMPEYTLLHKLTSQVLAIAAIVYVGHGLQMMQENLETFLTRNTLREFFIPIILSLLFLPYLYLVSVIMSYENTLLALRWVLKDSSLRRYAVFWAITRFRFDTEGLDRWIKHLHYVQPKDKKDIQDSISEIKKNQRREQNPPFTPPDLGWCPIAASKYLTEWGLETKNYHRIDNDEWWAGSLMKEINSDAILPDNIAYYIEGDETAAKRLIVKLNVNDRKTATASDIEFRKICAKLLKLIAENISSEQKDEILQSDVIDKEAGGRRICLQKNNFINPNNGYSRIMTVDHSPDFHKP